MSIARSMTLREFGQEFPREMAKRVKHLGKVGEVEVASSPNGLKAAAIRATPVGGGVGVLAALTKTKVAGRDPHPGLMKRSWEVTRGPNGAAVTNTAPHARVIEGGRRRSKKVKGRKRRKNRQTGEVTTLGRMLGSPQAPRGVKRVAVRNTMAQREALLRRIYAASGWDR